MTLSPAQAHASFLSGEALDTMANVVSWAALVVAPIALITVFWLVHIMPEKIAEKKKHPQAKAIEVRGVLARPFNSRGRELALVSFTS